MGAESELAAERAHLERARRCLVAMRVGAEARADYGVDALASQGLGRLRARRLTALAADPDAPPFFGRTDRDDTRPGHPDEVLHIGRRHVRDADLNPVVIDWRAPISRPFYRATPADRMGVTRRRRFGFGTGGQAGELTSFEDEQLDRGEQLGLGSRILRAEIERPRVGPMRDIVSTIQPDQDELVRADLDTSVCIQGSPGTGKTAVGLHRAAYLLYSYPERLRRTGVLVVGPNAAFLQYIAQVLPALGEGGIAQATVEDLVSGPARGPGPGPGPRGRRSAAEALDPVDVAVLKGDARLAGVLRRAVESHVRRPVDDVVAAIGPKRYRIGAHHLRRYVDDARRQLRAGDLHWTAARERLRLQLAEDVRRQREAVGGAPTDAETGRLANSPAVRAAVDAVWPALDAPALLARLYSDAEFRDRCANALTPAERAQLHRPAPPTARAVRWSAADRVLLDELGGIIDGTDAYVHIVVDEAQDLSAMQCRVVARRSPLGSLTVLGDLAQATTPWAPGSWPATLAHLGRPEADVRALTVGYRVPGEVLEVANRLLPHIAPDLPPAQSIRAGTGALAFVARAGLVAAVERSRDVDGSIGVICADASVAEVVAELRAAGLPVAPLAGTDGAGPADAGPADAAEATDERRVTVVPAGSAKGLEFDSVVLVEPAAIVAAEASRTGGLRRLYVVLTRAVSRLVIVHDDPLPPELA